MLILSEKDLRSVLSMAEVIAAVENGFKLLAADRVRIPERLNFQVPGPGTVLEMPAFAVGFDGSESAFGTKIVSVFEKNRDRGLDAVQATYLLFDPETGQPLALMDGRYVTAIRTAATSALATRLMAPPGPKRLAVFGAGIQAAFHIQAMKEVANVRQVLIASRTRERAGELARRVASEWGLQADVVSATEAASRGNLICTCTPSATPLFDGALIVPGTHINAIGAFTPDTREVDSETVRRARLIIDGESAAGREAGDILIPMQDGVISDNHIKGALADVVSGRTPGRLSPDEITLFKSCGLAVEDLVTAQLAYRKAIAQGIGTRVAM